LLTFSLPDGYRKISPIDQREKIVSEKSKKFSSSNFFQAPDFLQKKIVRSKKIFVGFFF